MLHLFYIHSHITFYSSLGTIKVLNLSSNDVVFLLGRKYKVKGNYEFVTVDVSNLSDQFSRIDYKKILSFNRNVRKADNYLSQIIKDEEFVAYVPQVSSLFFQLLITNRHCKGYNFIEEGIANYRIKLYSGSTNKVGFISQILIKFINSFSKRFMLYPSCLGMYEKLECSPRYYLFNQPLFLSEFNVDKIDFLPEIMKDKIDDCNVIIVFSASVEYSLISLNELTVLIERYIMYCQLNALKKIGLKFHPMQSVEVKDIICSQFANEDYSVIDDNVEVERLVKFNDSVVILGLESSVLLYAKVFGKNTLVVSFISFYNNNLRKEKFYSGYKEVEEIFKENGIVLI
ncbi:hypothetical protein AV926_06205 [Myroides marinus]|uniref:Uncharacterized protein n=1 Tax=Myroides marinus TaxID=703342 RepID=A0A164A1H1_9FLAO|nr:polysialyltransferase family glycosyltransferase [Myroides marinus]KZE82828.1 hypothetical protein AV926_06205 [Myroides marinus]